MKKLIGLSFVSAILLIMSCTITFNVIETTVSAENEMFDLEITYTDGSRYNIVGIDLIGVEIGDVYFEEILAGTTTTKKLTTRRGTVDIYVDSVKISYKFLGRTVSEYFRVREDITTVNILENKDNVVTFDENTAEDFLKYLSSNEGTGKKIAKIKKNNN